MRWAGKRRKVPEMKTDRCLVGPKMASETAMASYCEEDKVDDDGAWWPRLPQTSSACHRPRPPWIQFHEQLSVRIIWYLDWGLEWNDLAHVGPTLWSRKKCFIHTWQKCPPHLNNVGYLRYLVKMKHHISYLYNRILLAASNWMTDQMT